MSATARGAQRRRLDDYPTPQPAIRSLAYELHPVRARQMVWAEPAAGAGAIITGLWRHLAIEPGDWLWAEAMEGSDYVADGVRDHCGTGWQLVPVHRRALVTNPPYGGDLPQQFIERSLEESGFAAYLLRQGFRASAKRRDWWQGKEPTHLFTLAERPSYVDACRRKGCNTTLPSGVYSCCPKCGGQVGRGTDAADYEWYVWDRVGLCLRRPGIYII